LIGAVIHIQACEIHYQHDQPMPISLSNPELETRDFQQQQLQQQQLPMPLSGGVSLETHWQEFFRCECTENATNKTAFLARLPGDV
jgi:hypothetical protein